MDVCSYDPAIARWTSIDLVAHHSMSTYTAFDNNPIYWADLSGADSERFNSEIVNDVWNRSNEDGYAYIYDGYGSLTGVTPVAIFGILPTRGAGLEIKSIDRSISRKLGYHTLFQ